MRMRAFAVFATIITRTLIFLCCLHRLHYGGYTGRQTCETASSEIIFDLELLSVLEIQRFPRLADTTLTAAAGNCREHN